MSCLGTRSNSLPRILPAGDYRVMVILYDRETVKKAAGVDLATGLSSDIHPVISFAVDG